ncbi:MAG: SIMPL domain-containing protein [Myxococcota bacterium]
MTTFGSHVLRVSPDRAAITAVITRLAAEPADAFGEAREATNRVRAFLRAQAIDDREVRSSRITLQTRFRRASGIEEFVGHQASVEISVALDELDKLETLLVGMVESGADQVRQVRFHTTRLREHRATARVAALEAARDKAELYCKAAGVKLGKVLHIEDTDPTRVGRRGYGHMVDQDVVDTADNHSGAYDPGAISVNGAVVVSFAIL